MIRKGLGCFHQIYKHLATVLLRHIHDWNQKWALLKVLLKGTLFIHSTFSPNLLWEKSSLRSHRQMLYNLSPCPLATCSIQFTALPAILVLDSPHSSPKCVTHPDPLLPTRCSFNFRLPWSTGCHSCLIARWSNLIIQLWKVKFLCLLCWNAIIKTQIIVRWNALR